MRRVIISTIGTSLLTNQIDRSNSEEKNWYSYLRDAANLSQQNISSEVRQIIAVLKQRGNEQLSNASISQMRRASAELNGIYGIYQNNLKQGVEDIHFLIATDTIQGETAAQIVKDFLTEKCIINTSIYIPKGLSTASTESFSLGIDELIVWLQENIPPLKLNGYKIYFNLVGSFKSLQGYLNTIGMFYADEIIYIFEGDKSELITIPRLPVTIDFAAIQPYAIQLALVDAGMIFSSFELQGLPEAMIAEIDGQIILSTWGQLIWNQSKFSLLSGDLLCFPKLEYKDSFKIDYKKIKEVKEKVQLQQILAKVSTLLSQSNGDTSILKQDGGLQYDKYTNKGKIDHFRVTQAIRVSCSLSEGTLLLHRYGKEEEVNAHPH